MSLIWLLPVIASAAPWNETKSFFTDDKDYGSSMVDAADLDGDGWIDLVFANGVGYDKGNPNSDQPQQAYKNEAGVATTNISDQVFGAMTRFNGRAIKARDIDQDGDNDIILGVTWQGQSQLFINDGLGNFNNKTSDLLPATAASIGDLEIGDVDNDGDLDIMLADWGPDSPVSDINTPGGTTQLWLQDGDGGKFEDASLTNMPNVSIRWSWNLELVDFDNDYDLDAVVSCFACTKASLYLFENDGDGVFTQDPANVVDQGALALDVEPMDLNGDGFLDLVTLHDGTGGRNRVLIGDGKGSFEDKSDLVWPKLENPASYDHMLAFLDANSDGRPDLAVGALQPGNNVFTDRLMENQNGKFKQNTAAFAEDKPSGGTYAIVLADFNQDRILDLAMSQNENATEKKVFLGDPAELLADSYAPVFVNYQKLAADIEFGADQTLHLRCHDNKSPLMLHDFQSGDNKQDGRPYVESWNTTPADPEVTPPDGISAPGQWYGEYLWRVTFNVPKVADPFVYRICAIDAAGNKRCTAPESVDNPVEDTTGPGPTTTSDSTSESDVTTDGSASGTESMGSAETTFTTVVPTTGNNPTVITTGLSESATDTALTAGEYDDDGCGCATTQSPTRGLLSSLALLGLLGLLRRRPRA